MNNNQTQNLLKLSIVYKVPSTTFVYVPGANAIQQTYHPQNKTFNVKADSRRGRYLIGLVATKGQVQLTNVGQ